MKIVVRNGSPHLDSAASDMVNAFTAGAQDLFLMLGCLMPLFLLEL